MCGGMRKIGGPALGVDPRSRDMEIGLERLFVVAAAKKKSEAGFPVARGKGSKLIIIMVRDPQVSPLARERSVKSEANISSPLPCR